MALTVFGVDFVRNDKGTADELAGPTFSSTMVFHWPQAGQRPTHFGESAPHEVQNHIVRCCFFAMSLRVLEIVARGIARE